MSAIAGSKIINPGELCGGLSESAAKETGLLVGTPVAASLIEAHAGGLGVMGCDAESISKEFTSRLGKYGARINGLKITCTSS